jgi:hypothetical protein
MKLLICLLGWCLLWLLCWPLALLVLVLFPFVWLLSLPFRLVFYLLEGVVALVRALVLLPARILGGPKAPRTT